MAESVPAEISVADLQAVTALVDAVTAFLADPYEAALHHQCTHLLCTYRQLRERAREFADG